MALIYCGIDEAGYGPMLGPLCVGFSAFCVERWNPEAGAPDLWESLENAVCRKARDSQSRIAVADSKKLKLSNQSKTRHPLTHLERGVLAFSGLVDGVSRLCEPCGAPEPGATGQSPVPNSLTPSATSDSPHGTLTRGTRERQMFDTDTSLLDALGARLEPHEWYAGDRVALPLAGSRAQHAIARNKLALACEAAGVEPVALACIAVGEREFNEAVGAGGSKAHFTSRCFARYLRRALERWGGGTDDVRIICDRHGGRTSYTSMIEAAVRGLGFKVETLEESDRCSRYAVSGAGASPVPSIHIQFRPEAEEAHLPVALASMTAKLVRELAMGRFNRYWCGRMPELKPTAGYVQDARRWLEDLEGVLCDDEREAMVRKA